MWQQWKQDHQRGSIVELQGLYRDDLNSLSYNGLKTPIIIAHMYDISNCKKKKKIGQVGVCSNIAQNHSSWLQEVMSGHYLPPIHKISWPKVKFGQVIMIIIYYYSHECSLGINLVIVKKL